MFQHFPNIQKLKLDYNYQYECAPEWVFSKILPYIRAITQVTFCEDVFPRLHYVVQVFLGHHQVQAAGRAGTVAQSRNGGVCRNII